MKEVHTGGRTKESGHGDGYRRAFYVGNILNASYYFGITNATTLFIMNDLVKRSIV